MVDLISAAGAIRITAETTEPKVHQKIQMILCSNSVLVKTQREKSFPAQRVNEALLRLHWHI